MCDDVDKLTSRICELGSLVQRQAVLINTLYRDREAFDASQACNDNRLGLLEEWKNLQVEFNEQVVDRV